MFYRALVAPLKISLASLEGTESCEKNGAMLALFQLQTIGSLGSLFHPYGHSRQ